MWFFFKRYAKKKSEYILRISNRKTKKMADVQLCIAWFGPVVNSIVKSSLPI